MQSFQISFTGEIGNKMRDYTFFYTFAAIIDGDRALPAGIQKFTNKIIKRNTVDTDLI